MSKSDVVIYKMKREKHDIFTKTCLLLIHEWPKFRSNPFKFARHMDILFMIKFAVVPKRRVSYISKNKRIKVTM